MALPRALDVATSFAASATRMGAGMAVGPLGPRPARLLELYEFEACPYCRKVREALSMLDLNAMVYPCPGGGPRFREEVRRRGGKTLFPYLVDPNAGKEMYESDDIVRHLFTAYGHGSVPTILGLPVVTNLASMFASAWRVGMGGRYRPARQPAEPLELWSYEASPFCRIVRETLSSLELPYRLHNVAQGSARREEFVARSGRMMVPWLSDPNTGRTMFESADIVRYLESTYVRGAERAA
jgi:glutathione S-transferase